MLFDNVKSLAKKKGMSVGELERKAKLSNGSIFKWKTSSPKLDSAKAVADVLGTTVDKLLEERAEG